MKEYFLKTEVCIIGSGFCGYAAYKKLNSQNVDMVLIEGGKEETPKNSNEQNYYKVLTNKFINFQENIKIQNKLDPSFRDRKFTLGGSSECWTGWIKPFEESTYKNYDLNDDLQSWGNLTLSKYEKEVLNLLNSPIDNFDTKNLSDKLNLDLPKLSEGLSYTAYAWAKNDLRLKSYWTNKINKVSEFSKNKKKKNLILGYQLFDYAEEDNKIKYLKFVNESENSKILVEAKYFILGMGGIENPKFVNKLINNLDSKKIIKKYIGNFQEHPHLYNVAHFKQGKFKLPNILTERITISDRLHNSFKDGLLKFSLLAWDGPGTPKVTFDIHNNNYFQNKFINKFKNIVRNQIGKNLVPSSDFLVTMRCEQTPSASSKLNFSSNKTYLNWVIKDSDFKFYSKYLRRLGSFLIRNQYADDFLLTYPSKNNFAIPYQVYGGAHHMGTVPFLKNNLLINNKFQLTFLKNIYVVGCSSFPTSGFENPTHTAMATSIVAAEDIIKRLDK